jgi:uncharacterized membrane protein
MNSDTWAAVHGATTHFPTALAWSGAACDLAALLGRGRPWTATVRRTGGAAMIAAAVAAVPVAASGLVLARGDLWGVGALRWHHVFVWPALGLIVTAGAWRTLTWRSLTPGWHAAYVMLAVAIAGLLAGAGFWGGELLHRFP